MIGEIVLAGVGICAIGILGSFTAVLINHVIKVIKGERNFID